MPQIEEEFISRLRRKLLSGRLPPEEVDDLLTDYVDHFRIGRDEGRTEEDLSRSLGSPDEIARELIALHYVARAEKNRSPANFGRAVLATLALGLFNLVFVLAPFIVLLVLLAAIFLVGVGGAVTGPVLFGIAVSQAVGHPVAPIWLSPAAGLFLSVGITALGLLVMIGTAGISTIFYRLGISYLKWNISVIQGEESS